MTEKYKSVSTLVPKHIRPTIGDGDTVWKYNRVLSLFLEPTTVDDALKYLFESYESCYDKGVSKLLKETHSGFDWIFSELKAKDLIQELN